MCRDSIKGRMRFNPADVKKTVKILLCIDVLNKSDHLQVRVPGLLQRC